MITVNDSETIINYTRSIWYDVFGRNKIAPLTLVYDPLSKFTGIGSGLCHIAHDSIFFTNIEDSPDDRILVYDPKNVPYTTTVNDVENLPELQCIFICSYENIDDIKYVLSKLKSGGIVIVFNNIYKLPDNYVLYSYKTRLEIGWTHSFIPLEKQPKDKEDRLKSFQAFISP